MNLKQFFHITLISILCFHCSGRDPNTLDKPFEEITTEIQEDKEIIVGAARIDNYAGKLSGKRVGIVCNHSSLIGTTHLVDSLLSLGINIVSVFSPEHGFRGDADAGERIESNIDPKSGLPIISLYGRNKKPTKRQLGKLDVIIFDIQDVGVRFYTYISTMHYVMEACAESNKQLIVLDRPNPNGHYVDGPILEKKFKSFVGMHPVPIVHGMTIGEYARMINGQGWLSNEIKCNLSVIGVENYDHHTFYDLPVKPSPNLPNMSSIYLYPSLCLFEGTPISVGRGTDKPFQILGHPNIESDKYTFIPKSVPGATSPKLEGKECYGYDLSEYGTEYMKEKGAINLFWLLDIYKKFPNKGGFFSEMFLLLSGNDKLKQQIISGETEESIYKSWQTELTQFKAIRKKYLLYKDFE